MKKNYKSILGLNTVKAFIVVLLALAIIAVVTLIVLGALTNDTIISQVGTDVSGLTANETTTTVNETGVDLAVIIQVSAVCSNHIVINSSSDVIAAGNYTLTNDGCTIAFATGGDATANNTIWQVDHNFLYKDSEQIRGISDNVSTGITAFFGNSATFFALLAVVVIILIISLVVVIVNRFGGTGQGGSSETPSL